MAMKPNLAETPTEDTVITWPKYGSFKLDGIRSMGQSNTMLTRSLKAVPNENLRSRFMRHQGTDGEFITGEPNDPQVYNKTYRSVMAHDAPIDDVKFYVFDALIEHMPFHERLNVLKEYALTVADPALVVLEQTLLHSKEELDSFYESALNQGYEGVILRNPNAMYKQGRSTLKSQDMLKFKPLIDTEFVIEDVYEAETNLNEAFTNELGRTARSTHQANKVGNGMAGGFWTTWTNSIRFKVAAGSLTHAERTEIWANKEKYIGKVGIFRYMPGGMVDAPRHPRFKGWRHQDDM